MISPCDFSIYENTLTRKSTVESYYSSDRDISDFTYLVENAIRKEYGIGQSEWTSHQKGAVPSYIGGFTA